MGSLIDTRPRRKQPLVICYGGGRDSTAVLVGLWMRGIRPDLILMADVGAERQATYDYVANVMQPWLLSIGFPPITIVRYVCTRFKHWPHYATLEENCLTNGTLPSIAYGSHACSSKWKIAPQTKYLQSWTPALLAWQDGVKIRKAIGFEAGEENRTRRCSTYAVQDEELDLFDIWFPLQEWGWTLAACIEAIEHAGLPVPPKSSCYFCTAMKPWEVDALPIGQLKRIVVIEARAYAKHYDYCVRKNWPKGEGVLLTEGIWRKRVKGMRGAIAKPGSMTEYIREKGLLPSSEIDRIIAITPTRPLYRGEIENWQVWLAELCQDKPPTPQILYTTEPQLT